MAATGTITGVFDNEGRWLVTIAGVTQGSTSQVFTLKSAMFSSFTLSGTFGGTSAQWQGSNDGTNWDNIGTAITGASGGTLTPGGTFYRLYQLNLTGGDGTTSINVTLSATIPR